MVGHLFLCDATPPYLLTAPASLAFGRQSALGHSSHTDRRLCLGMQIMNNFICFATSAIHPQTGRPRERFLKQAA